MTKIGRNASCPCGSGKKYKKCCLGKEKPLRSVTESGAPALPTRAPPSNLASRGSSAEISPYLVAKLFEESEHFARMQRREPMRARQFCTPRKVAALSTEEIVDRLRKLGVDATRGTYLAQAKGRTSAWTLSEPWREASLTKPLSRYDDDFLGLAACELWRRYCPERPSIEMLDDEMQAGYRRSMEGEGARACAHWARVWKTIRERLRPEMRTIHDAVAVFSGTQSLYNWIQDYLIELRNVAVDQRSYTETGVRLCEEVLAQFPDQDELFLINFRGDMGEFLCLAGEPERGERVFLELIRDYPDNAAGYVRLADLLGYGPTPGSEAIDRQRAQRVLEEALARPVTDAAIYDLELRLSDLRRTSPPEDEDFQA
jgi:hypothetical protein